MSYEPSFAIINMRELQRLNQEKASASVMSVYLALCAYAQGKNSCFPSIGTIKSLITGSITKSTISKCLRWLREKGFIEQNHRTSKERFKMVYRAFVKASNHLVQRAKTTCRIGHKERVQTDNRSKNHRGKPFFGKKNKFFKKKKAMGYGRFGNSQKEANNEPVCKAEQVYGDWLARNTSRDVKTLSQHDLSIIAKALRSDAPQDREWREIMSWCEQNKATFDRILQV
jgi:hypothetical protein